MPWRRGNHLLPQWGDLERRRHDGIAGLLLGDGPVRFTKDAVDPVVEMGLGTIAGNEPIPGASC